MTGERGGVSVLVVSMLAILALFCLAFIDAAAVVVARARAQAAADAAALAAASGQWPFLDGDDAQQAAADTAQDNGAELIECVCALRGLTARVVVEVPAPVRVLGFAPRRVRASAAASLDPGVVFQRPP